MQADGFFVTRAPKPGFDWTSAAVRFVETRTSFLKEVTSPVACLVGEWWLTCFPFKGLTNRKIDSFSKEEIQKILKKTREFREFTAPKRYDRIHGVEVLFRKELEYPPYSLKDLWDGHTIARTHWAEYMFRHSGIIVR